jgi:hypothetical protein
MLGFRFRALIIVPAIFVAVPIVAVEGVTRGDSLKWLALVILSVILSLQAGYLIGCALHSLIAAARRVTLSSRPRFSKSV